MKRLCIVSVLALAAALTAPSQQASSPFAGRWDLTVTAPDATYPSWLEVTDKAGSLAARTQPREGSVRESAAKMDGARLIVTVAAATPERPASDTRPATPARPALTWELTAKGGKLTGVQKFGDVVQGQVAGAQAPALKRDAPKAWTNPEPLFNGKDLAGWVTMNNTQNPNAKVNHWVAKDGELVNEAQGHNIATTRKFGDFKLHVEFNLTASANSGIYLRGRYEAQMPPPGSRRTGGARGSGGTLGYAIYGFVRATADAPGDPAEWRTYDLTLVGRSVTLVVDGITIVANQEVAGITGGALDSNEAEPGPIYLQGDHTGGIRYRNITISEPKR
jgi:hypothetical protein